MSATCPACASKDHRIWELERAIRIHTIGPHDCTCFDFLVDMGQEKVVGPNPKDPRP